MKVLTLNTWQKRGPWEDRWNIIFSFLESEKPDIVGFQEVFDEDWKDYLCRKSGYADSYFPVAQSGLLFLSRYPVLEKGMNKYETQAESEDYSRYAIYIKVHSPLGSLFAFNTHLSWKLHEEDARKLQCAELSKWSLEISGARPALAMGDFNAPDHETGIELMNKVGQFEDSYGQMNPDSLGYTWDAKNPYTREASSRMPNRRLDYIFFRNYEEEILKLKSAQMVLQEPDRFGVFASDHFGTLTLFES